MIIKSYRELCKVLNIKEKTSNSKKAQMNEFDRFVKYKKIGYKFSIQEIYETPLKKQDGRTSGNNSKYVEDIEKLILDLLAQDDNKGTVELSVGKLLETLNMINQNYRECRQDIPRLSEFLNVEIGDVYDFYNSTQSKLKSNLKRALEKLRSSRLVYVTPFITVSVHNPHAEKNEDNFIHRPATKNEMESILKAEKMTMQEMDMDSINAICASGSYRKWKSETNRKLYNWNKINYYYECYRITNYKEGVLKLLDEIERKETKSKLNQTVKQSTIDTATNKHNRKKEKGWFGKGNKRECFPKYVDNATILANNIIDEKACRIILPKKKK